MQVVQKPKASGMLLKWVIELSQFDISYKPWTAIKDQALVDFIAEFTYNETTKLARTANAAEAAKVIKKAKNEALAET